MEPKAKLFFEVSWEVCNKVGGIHTVVTSKAPAMMQKYAHYYLVGPYFPSKTRGIFDEIAAPDMCKDCFEQLKNEGIEVHVGKWLIKGEPSVILVDYSAFSKKVNEIKKQLWEQYQLDSLNTEFYDFDEPVVWSWAVGKVIASLCEVFDLPTVAQFHEWLSGAAMLYLKSNKSRIGTVFTTHATMLGRTLATKEVDIYSELHNINPEEEAQKHGPGLWAKFQMERICARNSDVFTTVSSITGLEASAFLGKNPDVLLPNGLDIDEFPALDEASIRHRNFKKRIKLFLTYYFYPYYNIDLDNTLIYFIAGRYEFRDKGIDIFIKSLAKLNKLLKEEKSNKTIVAFFWIPANIKGIKTELLENRTLFYDIKDSMDDYAETMKNRITTLLVSGGEISKQTIFHPNLRRDLQVKVRKLKKTGLPPLSTHDLYNEDQDPILNALKANNLLNTKQDKVKVVYYPIYLTGADGLLDTTYYESMNGGHLGVFPSFYEPWGYTPLEAAALSVSALTTDVSGFGAYINEKGVNPKHPGIFVIPRMGKSNDEILNSLTKVLHDFSKLSTHDRVENKINAKKLAERADWKVFADNYIEAHNLAMEKKL